MQHPHIELRPSKIFAVILILIYSGATICLNLSAVPIYLKIIFTLFIMIIFLFNFNKIVLLKNEKSLQVITADKKHQWHLINRAGKIFSAQICGDSICTRWLVILNFRVTGIKKILSILVFPDATTTEDFRRLRAYLRIMSRKLV